MCGQIFTGNAMQDKFERNLTQRFPDKKSHIVQLEVANTGFRDLCRDYEECVRVLEKLNRDPQVDAQRVGEYRDLKIALEAEALEYIESMS
jgi:hypothetical protein